MHNVLFRIAGAAVLLAASTVQAFAAPAEPVASVRLYAIDCGHLALSDLGSFSDTGEYDGKAGTLIDSCYLIQHPKGTLLWDTGLGDAIGPAVKDLGFVKVSVPKPLLPQLASIGVTPANLDYLAVSHAHFDHTGNANAFSDATWLLEKAEMQWVETTPGAQGVDAANLEGRKTAKTQAINGDHDVFGDGSVRILKAPGHTPGHAVLAVKLKKAGTVVLSGDLYHTRENRSARRVPAFNVSRADTLASIDRIEKIVKNTHARFIVQHDEKDFASLPVFPAYLD